LEKKGKKEKKGKLSNLVVISLHKLKERAIVVARVKRYEGKKRKGAAQNEIS